MWSPQDANHPSAQMQPLMLPEGFDAAMSTISVQHLVESDGLACDSLVDCAASYRITEQQTDRGPAQHAARLRLGKSSYNR